MRDYAREAYNDWVKLNKARISPKPVKQRQTRSKSSQAIKTGQTAPNTAKKRPKAVKRYEPQAYGVSVHPVLGLDNESTVGVQYRVQPGSGVQVSTIVNPDGVTYITIYTPSNAAPTREKN